MENPADPMHTAPTTVPTTTVGTREIERTEGSAAPTTSAGNKTPRRNLRNTKPRPSRRTFDPASVRIKKCRVDIKKGLPEDYSTTSHNAYKPASPLGFALRDSIRRRFGAEWLNTYNNSVIRRALRAELRSHLADEIDCAIFDFTAPLHEASRERSQCRCYLHKYFHADARLTFLDCYLQRHHDDRLDNNLPR